MQHPKYEDWSLELLQEEEEKLSTYVNIMYEDMGYSFLWYIKHRAELKRIQRIIKELRYETT